MTGAFTSLARARLLATGSQLNLEPPARRSTCRTDADLDRLITSYYRFFNEEMSADTTFLLGVRRDRDVESFRRLMYDLRTAANHSDNETSAERAKAWRAGFGSPQDAADSLADLLDSAIVTLSEIAIQVARTQDLATRWKEILLVDTDAVFASVQQDLGLKFTAPNRRRMVRLIDKRLEVQPVQGDRRAIVADYCVQEMLSNRRPLPVTYDAVLDALGALGAPIAVGVLLVAHSVAAIAPELHGEEYLERVRQALLVASTGEV